MPLYEYQCAKCQEVSEHLQKMSDPAPETCPSCGAKGELSKVLSASAFHLKGGGWYADAYSSKKPKEEGKKADKSPAAEAPKEKTKTKKKASSSSKPDSSAKS